MKYAVYRCHLGFTCGETAVAADSKQDIPKCPGCGQTMMFWETWDKPDEKVEKKFPDIMTDIEAMGTGVYGMITQIGACYFDLVTGEIGDKFSVNISMENSYKEGFVIDPGAVKFWLNESNRTFLGGQLLSVREALGKYSAFASKAKRMWSHQFDFVLIQQALEKVKLDRLQYKKWKDINTLVWLSELTYDKTDNVRSGAHDGLSDAIYQAGYCSKAYNKLKEKNTTIETQLERDFEDCQQQLAEAKERADHYANDAVGWQDMYEGQKVTVKDLQSELVQLRQELVEAKKGITVIDGIMICPHGFNPQGCGICDETDTLRAENERLKRVNDEYGVEEVGKLVDRVQELEKLVERANIFVNHFDKDDIYVQLSPNECYQKAKQWNIDAKRTLEEKKNEFNI